MTNLRKRKNDRSAFFVSMDGDMVTPFEREGDLEEVERENKAVTRMKGLLFWNDGTLVSNGNHKFVVAKNGCLYIADTAYHSQILATEDVQSAGHVIMRSGKIAFIDNSSGHYHPPLGVFLLTIHGLMLEGYLPNPFQLGTRATTEIADNKTVGEIFKPLLGKKCEVRYDSIENKYVFLEPTTRTMIELPVKHIILGMLGNEHKGIESKEMKEEKSESKADRLSILRFC